jgi:carboxyl-terminal processing protease
MKAFRSLRFTRSFWTAAATLCLLACFGPVAVRPLTAQKSGGGEPDHAQITVAVSKLLESIHYSRQRLDDEGSARLLKNYLETLDYNHLFFTQKDVDALQSVWAARLDDEIHAGRTTAAHQIYDIFRQRAESRVAWAKDLLQSPLDFNGTGHVELNRSKASWPADEEEAKNLWKDRITSELLQEKLVRLERQEKKARESAREKEASKEPAEAQKASPKSGKVPSEGTPDLEPDQTVAKRYDRFLRDLRDQTAEDVLKTFLLSLAQIYDPHSEYLGKADLEQFAINMRLSLFGIGAKLRSEDGYAKIVELVPGGPALKSGKIKAGDRIVSVAQGDKEFVDCVDLKLDKVVGMIRGKKDTVVRLQIIPVDSTTGSDRVTVEIRRDEIKLKDEAARAELIEWPKPNGQSIKLGLIVLPSFYGDPDRTSNPNAKSTSRDVQALIRRLKQEGIQGLVMDLRRNGGGFLDEAVNLSGLFIKQGPVVQTRSWNGEIAVSRDKDSRIEYDGPLLVLVNRQSASASEIFAGAMQDYGRAVIIGDSKTFGKGTVQQMIELSRAFPLLGEGADPGAVKPTIQKFYRVAGGSTQLRGVESDIVLPSIYDQPELGEESLKDPLAYDTLSPLEFEKWDKNLHIGDLKNRSDTRIPLSKEFQYVMEDLTLIRKRTAENRVSLNQAQRQSQMAEEKKRKEHRDQERLAVAGGKEPRAFRITLDNVDQKQLVPIRFTPPKAPKETPASIPPDEEDVTPGDGPSEPQKDKDGKVIFKAPPIRFDPVKEETLNVLVDLIEMTAKETAPPTAKRRER